MLTSVEIVVIVVGIFVVVCFLVFLFIWYANRRKSRTSQFYPSSFSDELRNPVAEPEYSQEYRNPFTSLEKPTVTTKQKVFYTPEMYQPSNDTVYY